MRPTSTTPKLHAGLELLATVPTTLHGSNDVAELLSRAAVTAREICGFDRAVILGVGGSTFTAEASGPLPDEASDDLRRRVLERSVPIVRDSPEGCAVFSGARSPGLGSPLAERLGLRHLCLIPLVPEDRCVALLVLDREGPAVERADRAMSAACGAMIAAALSQAVLRARIGDLDSELRYLTVSAHAMMGEITRGPITLPTAHGERPAFPLLRTSPREDGSATLQRLLSDREITVGTLIAEGLSNREIADRLFLSPDTVKGHVARILRKFDASNRVEAATRFIALRDDAGASDEQTARRASSVGPFGSIQH